MFPRARYVKTNYKHFELVEDTACAKTMATFRKVFCTCVYLGCEFSSHPVLTMSMAVAFR